MISDRRRGEYRDGDGGAEEEEDAAAATTAASGGVHWCALECGGGSGVRRRAA